MNERTLQVQLEKAHVDLAEVIDEVVFAENERSRMERMLEDHRRETRDRQETLIGCIQSLAEYVHVLEQRIIIPAVGTVVTSLGEFHTTRARNVVSQTLQAGAAISPIIREEFAKLSAPSEAALTRAARNAPLPTGVSIEDALRICSRLTEQQVILGSKVRTTIMSLNQYNGQTQPIPPQKIFEDVLHEMAQIRQALASRAYHHAQQAEEQSVVAALEGVLEKVKSLYDPHLLDVEATLQIAERVTNLESELNLREARIATLEAASSSNEGRTKNDASSVANSIHVVKLLQAEVTDLRGALDEQQRIHDASLLKAKRKNEKLQEQLSNVSSAAALSHGDSLIQRDYAAKIKAFEMTIHSLNGELAAIEGRSAMGDAQHTEELQAMKMEIQLERRDRRAEREEYDTMLNRVTTEIEKLMKENVELKQRIRQEFD